MTREGSAISRKVVRTPAERARGTAAGHAAAGHAAARQPVTVAFGRATTVADPGAFRRQNIAAAADRIRLLLADHVRLVAAGYAGAGHAAARAAPTAAGPPRGPADPGGSDR